MSNTYMEQSRKKWLNNSNRGQGDDKSVELGCLQRVANSLETIAQDKTALIEERDSLQRSLDWWMARSRRLDRSNSALRGVITRLRNKLKKRNES